jgi:predicted RNA-binding Zn ribbon-like protein
MVKESCVEALPLDPGEYEGTYKLVAGEPSLDFVNTVSWPGTDREHDWLDRAHNLTRWAEAAGIIDGDRRKALEDHPSQGAEVELAATRNVRSALRDVLAPLGHEAEPLPEAVEVLNGHIRRACSHRVLDPDTTTWTWVEGESLTDLLWPVIWNAGHVLTEVDRRRIGHCPACDWLFVDTSRNRSRRWCDMADCGSREKALRYYHRTKARG